MLRWCVRILSIFMQLSLLVIAFVVFYLITRPDLPSPP
jgi:hypothetical protein